jgi:hypothetical protein
MDARSVVRTSAALVALGIGGLAARHTGPPDPRADLFVRRGCSDCHAIVGLGVKASADVGPDLTYAYGDVVIRYGTSLESFLENPTGVMRLMLAAHLHLRPSERDSMVQVLKGLYVERSAELEAPPRVDPVATSLRSR